jgi:hypothetical protein
MHDCGPGARSASAALRARCPQLAPGHLVQYRGELPFPFFTGVKIDPRGASRGMAHPVHQLAERSACFGGQRVAGMPQVMDV